MRSINECLRDAVENTDSEFRRESKAWPLVKRNYAITARNRNMRKICDMLEMPFTELPLEKPEAA